MIVLGTSALLITTSVLAAVYLFATTFTRKRRPLEPPIVKGSLIWGSAVEFSTHAVKFLHRATEGYGKIFTIRLINQYLTIVNDVHAYEALSKEKNFDFDPIQKQVNWNVFSFVLAEPRKMIKDTGRTVRGTAMVKNMKSFVSKLDNAFDKLAMPAGEWQEGGLRTFTADTLFTGLFNSIFGHSDDHFFNAKRTYGNFETFHKFFNFFWLGFPKHCFPSAMRSLEEMLGQPKSEELLSRPDVSDYIKSAIEFMQSMGQSETDMMGHNLVYLHVNYNTFRLAFWVLANLLENEKAMNALMNELEVAISDKHDSETNTSTFTANDIEELPILDSVCQEAMRLSSGVFVVRYVQQDTLFTGSDGKQHLMRAGDRVAMYPPAIHKDPEIFENPLEYKYDRFVDAKFYKDGKEVKHPVIAFGSLCPGKRFAILQLKWFIVKALTRFELSRKTGERAAEYDYQYHGHEILPPVSDVTANIRQRQHAPTLAFQ